MLRRLALAFLIALLPSLASAQFLSPDSRPRPHSPIYNNSETVLKSITIGTPSAVTGQLSFLNSTNNNITTWQAGAASASKTYTWPLTTGSAGAVLTDAAGNGTLSWAVPSVSALTVGTTAITGGAVGNLLYTDGSLLQASATVYSAAQLQLGQTDAAAPVAQTLQVQSVVAGTSNTAGANFTIIGSKGTGTGAGGNIIFQLAPAGGTGTSQNAPITVMTINSAQQILHNSLNNPNFPQFSSTLDTTSGMTIRSGDVEFMVGGSRQVFLNASTWQFANNINIFNMGSNTAAIQLGNSLDTILLRDGAGIWAQRNATTAQIFRVYNTFTSGTSYERGVLDWATNANVFTIGTEKGSGGGSVRNMEFEIGGTNQLDFGVTSAGSWSLVPNIKILSATTTGPGVRVYLTGEASLNNRVFLGLDGSDIGVLTFGLGGATAPDVMLRRAGVWDLQFGPADANSGTAQTTQVQSVVAGNSNTAGANWTIIGSKGTGTGPSGNIIFEVGKTGSTGTVQNSPFPMLTINAGAATTATIQFGDGTNFTTYDSCTGLTTGATGVIACTASALRFKNPIGWISADDLSALRPAMWTYKDPERFGEGEFVGLYADDVEKMDSRCATYENGQLKDYRDRCVIAHLVANVQKQQAEIEQIKQRIH